MNISALLLAEFPQLTFSATQSAKAAGEHPRDVVSANIGHCIAYLNDATYTHTVRGKPQKPTPCYVVTNGIAKVTLTYGRVKLKVDQAGNTDMNVPVTQLSAVLARLKALVDSSYFDPQLDAIKSDRVALQKAGIAKNKAA